MSNSVMLISLSTLCISFAIAYSVTLKKLARLTQECAKLFIDNKTLEEFIATHNIEFKNDSDIHKENFIKFLSDSRDWAFGYIEEVQTGLTKFVTDIEPEINYFKEYGDVTSMQPNYYSLKKITDAYDELTKLLPKEEEEVK
jgi:MoaA/NifB/PqqE/SkfB family radical SAM enzyme